MIHIEVSENLSSETAAEVLVRAAKASLAYHNASEESDLTILLTTDDQLHKLNLEYLGVDDPTDVLAFPADYIDPDTETAYLGDILISLERAELQAQAGGHSIEAELELLVVHGVLHLLGYDHAEPDEKSRMWAAQTDILAHLGSPLSPP
jgi:probable rRNA maturation factor